MPVGKLGTSGATIHLAYNLSFSREDSLRKPCAGPTTLTFRKVTFSSCSSAMQRDGQVWLRMVAGRDGFNPCDFSSQRTQQIIFERDTSGMLLAVHTTFSVPCALGCHRSLVYTGGTRGGREFGPLNLQVKPLATLCPVGCECGLRSADEDSKCPMSCQTSSFPLKT